MRDAIRRRWEATDYPGALRLVGEAAEGAAPVERAELAELLVLLARQAPRPPAEEAVRRAVALRQGLYPATSPMAVMAPWPLAEALGDWGERDAAVRVMSDALEEHPAPPRVEVSVCVLVAQLLERAHDLAGAEHWIRRALALPLDDGELLAPLNTLQRLLTRTGRLEEAAQVTVRLAETSRTLRTHPTVDDAARLGEVARAWLAAGHPERALPLAERARRIASSAGPPQLRGELALDLGEALLALGRDASEPLADATRQLSGRGGSLARRLEALRRRQESEHG